MGKSKKDVLVRCAVAMCVLYTLLRLCLFVYGRIPPYSEGQCLSVKKNPYVQLQIIKNHLIEGYSDVKVSVVVMEKQVQATFPELRDLEVLKVECE